MAFDSAVLAAFASGDIGGRVFLIKFEFDDKPGEPEGSGTLYFTTIPNGKDYQDPLRDDVSHFYTYLGAIGSVGTVSENESLDPAEYEITIGSADTVILSTFLSEPSLNRKVTCYQALINEDQSFVESGTDLGPWIYFQGSMQPSSINDGLEPTITVPVKDELADWDREITSLYTDAEQQRLHAGDLCLENVSRLAASDIIWPTAELLEARG